MQINVKIEMNDLSIAQMCLYAVANRLLFNPSRHATVQMAWNELVFITKTNNELDLYKAVSEIEI